MMNQTKEIPELLCSICLCLFNFPTTLDCGHTFCRHCLLQSLEAKKDCPICRANITSLMERPNPDQTICSILKHISKAHFESYYFPLQLADSRRDTPISSILLIDITTKDLLLPFTKVTATFELQSSSLICKLDRFVARQEAPFNRFGVISKICTINQLKYNVYECTIEGSAFCMIEKEWVERKADNDEQYYYRRCKGEEIGEYSEMDIQNFDTFFFLFSQIKEPKTLEYVYKCINPHTFSRKKDPVALYYSIMRIINIPDEQKYDVIIKFDERFRMGFLNGYLREIEYEKKVSELIYTPKNRVVEGCLVGCVFLLFFLAIACKQFQI